MKISMENLYVDIGAQRVKGAQCPESAKSRVPII